MKLICQHTGYLFLIGFFKSDPDQWEAFWHPRTAAYGSNKLPAGKLLTPGTI